MIVKITGQASQVMRWYYTERPLRRELMQTELSQCLHVGMMINKDGDDHGNDEDGDDDGNTSGNKDGMFRSKDGGRRSRMCT